MEYIFFKEDLEELVQKRDNLKKQLLGAGQELGEATEQSSETWHDNAPFDVAKQEFHVLANKHQELDHIIKHSKIIEAPKSNVKIAVGSLVEYENQEGEKKQIKIGSYIPGEHSGAISYNAPIAKILLGAKKGGAIKGKIADREVIFNIINIS